MFCFCPTRLRKSCGKLNIRCGMGGVVPNVGVVRFCRFIVMVTNRVVVRDLEVLVPPNFMLFRRASFWTCPKKHTYTILLNFLGRLGLGWGQAGVGAGLGTGIRH